MSCEICREYLSERVILVGGLNVYLCAAHANEWHEHIVQTATYFHLGLLNLEYASSMALIAAGKSSFDPAVYNRDLATRILTTEMELYKESKYWLAKKKELSGIMTESKV